MLIVDSQLSKSIHSDTTELKQKFSSLESSVLPSIKTEFSKVKTELFGVQKQRKASHRIFICF